MALKTVLISPDAAGMRLDRYIRKLLPDLPESTIRKLFASRDVKLDKTPAHRDDLLRSGQELRIYLPDRMPDSRSQESLRIVYEDDDILLVNKPGGISVEQDMAGSLSLTELCLQHVTASGPVLFPPAACHRLDNKTSGLCLFAKNAHALAVMEDAFRTRTVEKYYICLVRGIMKPPSAVCSAFLVKDSRRAVVRITDSPSPDARPVVTGYETLESGPVSRLRVHLITGRTHQIRAHLAALGHPVLGDDLYGDRAFNRQYKARSLKLCAVSLRLDTGGAFPALDGREFTIDPPF
ncbi:MAG: RluA family pseudouridine synthase [Clostridia bacterium]|nr:RluA family pseudouridine synthase [Clostridia bacterium]